MMNVMVKTAGKGLANKTDRTPEEDDMLDMMVNGGKRVSLQNLKAVTKWYKSVYQQEEKRIEALGVFMRVETERMYLYPLSDEEMRLVIENESDPEMKQAYTEMLEGSLSNPDKRIWYAIWNMELKDESGIIVGDRIEFTFEKLEPIREEGDYNNFRVYFVAHYGKIANKMKIDITTGDEITSGAIRYSYKTILDDDEIGVMAYNTETIIAEKYETIIRRNIGTSRARDFYDLHVFYNLYKDSINLEILKLAVTRIAKKRESLDTMSEWEEIIEDMKVDTALKALWKNYCENNTYASEVSFENVMETTLHIAEMLGF